MIHKGWRMFSQNFRSIAHTPGLFKTLIIISNIFKALSEYLNIFECVLCHRNEYKYLFEHQNILIFKYSCSSLFLYIFNNKKKCQVYLGISILVIPDHMHICGSLSGVPLIVRLPPIDRSKWTGQNKWVKIDRSKYTGPKR